MTNRPLRTSETRLTAFAGALAEASAANDARKVLRRLLAANVGKKDRRATGEGWVGRSGWRDGGRTVNGQLPRKGRGAGSSAGRWLADKVPLALMLPSAVAELLCARWC